MAAAQVSVSSSASAPATEKRHRKYETAANANNRVGVIWTPEEEADLKREFFENKSLDEISQLHKRTPRSIELRLAKIAADELIEAIDSGTDAYVSASTVASKYRVTETMVQKALTKKAKKANPKPAPVKKIDLIARIESLEEQVRQIRLEMQQFIQGGTR